MSSFTPLTAAPTTTTTNYLSNIGLGYTIAIALGILVLLSTIILASYICCRASHRQHARNNTNNNVDNASSITLPRIIFVAEDDHELNRDDQNIVVGLDHAVINSYPKFTYTKKSSMHVHANDDDGDGDHQSSSDDNNNTTCCSICLCEYKECEMLRMMPECRHFFHLVCLDAWLKLNGSCPVCRNSPLPTPLSTPLSEVVPLSQYGDGRRTRR